MQSSLAQSWDEHKRVQAAGGIRRAACREVGRFHTAGRIVGHMGTEAPEMSTRRKTVVGVEVVGGDCRLPSGHRVAGRRIAADTTDIVGFAHMVRAKSMPRDGREAVIETESLHVLAARTAGREVGPDRRRRDKLGKDDRPWRRKCGNPTGLKN